jgi:hypothetical protein
VVEVTFEYVAPVAALILISVSIWGAAKKFTSMDTTIQNNQKDNERDFSINSNDIKRLQSELADLKKDVREIYTMLLKLNQKVEDRFQK